MRAEISLTFDQILELVRKLPRQEKVRLSQQLEEDLIHSQLTRLLSQFRTDELSFDEITEATEEVRQQLYEKRVAG